jgi:BirA family biotin operon repressor/biotin-[acetyl-CoA-carboxylase] ligase
MDLVGLLSVLADGEFHSGERLAAGAGLTRAAVWKQVRKLERWGLRVEAESGKGYRLSQPVELLDAMAIRRQLDRDERFVLDRLETFVEIDSTNRHLMHNPPSRAGTLRLCVAEWQSAGRGRLARNWVSPLGAGICVSAAWVYDGVPQGFSSLSLAAGIAVAKALRRCCAVEARLKWPNDLVWDSRKLGGVLVESKVESQGRCNVVVGVGINVAVPSDVLENVSDWRSGAADLRAATNDAAPHRNELVSAVAAELGALFADFAREGAETWLDAWQELDYLRGKAVCIESESASFFGTAEGIDHDGALLVGTGDGPPRRVLAGDAKVRPQ